ncbi:MAG: ribonuclease HI family protein [Patescibacteria group bacterium]
MKKITIFTDGGSRSNPGIAGAGAVIFDDEGNELISASKFLGIKTNNWAEYEAIILGLEKAQELFGGKLKGMEVEMKMDSQLVQRQLKREYRIKEPTLQQQFIRVNNLLIDSFPKITFTHIPRAENKRADELANEAMDQGK